MANIVIVMPDTITWWEGPQAATPAGLCTDIPALLLVSTLGLTGESTVVVPTAGGDRKWVYDRIIAAGYRTTPTEDGAWFTCWASSGPEGRGRPTVHLCILEWVDETDPLIGWLAQPDPFDSDRGPSLWAALNWWHTNMGGHYRHTPGVAAHVSMKAMMRREQPRWNPYRDRGPLPGFEPPAQITPIMFRSTTIGKTAAGKAALAATVTYDTNKAYLAAMAGADLPMGPLIQTGPTPAGPGYVRVRFSQPAVLEVLSHNPLWTVWGIKPDRQGCVWLGTNTYSALMYLLGSLEIVDSWTAPGKRVLRSWAEGVRDLIAEETYVGHAALAGVLKAAYTQAVGLFAVRRGTIIRPDWRHLLIDYSNASMIRKTIEIFEQTGGHAPVAMDVDSVTYPDTPIIRHAASLFVGDHIGQWREVNKP